MLLFSLIAASLVVATRAQAAIPDSARARPFAWFVDGDGAAPDPDHTAFRGAKHAPASPKRRLRTKRKAQGRSLAVASRQALGAIETRREPLAPRAALLRDQASGCPTGMALVGQSLCIDAYEASLVQILRAGQERVWPYFEVVPEDVEVRAVSIPDVYPQGYISGLVAREACERSGKRLCKPDEWRSACMGPKGTVFPYGSAREVGRCNDNGRSSMQFFNPQLDSKPEHRWMWGSGGNMVDPRLNQLAGTLTRTGERSGCTNEYGVYDMVGNLHEWVDDPDGTFQGGYYLDTHVNGEGCLYRTTAHPMSHFDYSTGFRCCADAP